ncbi:MAG TPA: hypothetical protein VJ732_15000 [Bryobacteraceae bacterium]|nr:hypothetical protein [Bryobacteraceae bacterium]
MSPLLYMTAAACRPLLKSGLPGFVPILLILVLLLLMTYPLHSIGPWHHHHIGHHHAKA